MFLVQNGNRYHDAVIFARDGVVGVSVAGADGWSGLEMKADGLH